MTKLSNKLLALLACVLTIIVLTGDARATCLNRFVVQSQNNKRILTLLTGELTFSEAKELARALQAKEVAAIEWIDASDKVIVASSKFSAVRPMPVSCGERSSGVVATLELLTFSTPSKTMRLKLPDGRKVTFVEQTN